MNREAIYQAAFDYIKSKVGSQYAVIARGRKHWDDSPMQPAMWVAEESEGVSVQRGLDAKMTLNVDVNIYAKVPTGKTAGQVMNPLLDALQNALKTNVVVQRITLGGLIEHMEINGEIARDGGHIKEQAVAVVPIVIYTTDRT